MDIQTAHFPTDLRIQMMNVDINSDNKCYFLHGKALKNYHLSCDIELLKQTESQKQKSEVLEKLQKLKLTAEHDSDQICRDCKDLSNPGSSISSNDVITGLGSHGLLIY